jgi:hypothetical protein
MTGFAPGPSEASHLSGLPPQISHAPSTPIAPKPPQDPAIGGLPRMTPTAMITITNRKTKNVIKNSIIESPTLFLRAIAYLKGGGLALLVCLIHLQFNKAVGD